MIDKLLTEKRERERERVGVVQWRRESLLASMGGFVGCWCLCIEACAKRWWRELRLKGEDEGKETCFFFIIIITIIQSKMVKGL